MACCVNASLINREKKYMKFTFTLAFYGVQLFLLLGKIQFIDMSFIKTFNLSPRA